MNPDFSRLAAGGRQAVEEMTAEITTICKNMKNREPGSESELKTALFYADVLKKDCGCADAKVETFREHPHSFYGYTRINSFFDVVACLGYFVHPAVGLVSSVLSVALFLSFFVFYRPVIDWMFPAQQGTNVTAIRPAGGEVKRRVLLNGHLDAAWEFTLNYHFGGIVFEAPNLISLIGIIYWMAIDACALFGAGAWTHTAALWGLVFLPFFVCIALTYNPKRIVDGANDNLSGCEIGVALLKEMENNGITLQNTEVGVVLTGSEEAGLRGAKAWSRAHREDYHDVPTFIVSYDTIHDPRFLAVNLKDLNGTVKTDEPLAEVFLAAARDAGVPCSRGQVPLFGGATDSAAFTQGGFRSVGVTGLNHVLEDYYHTRRDSYDNLNPEGLENCYQATVRLIERIDAGELDR